MKEFFKKTVLNLAKESKCVSRQVGAIIVRDNRIISMGYNGTISGAKNCNEIFNFIKFNRDKHTAWSKNNELHAEQNAIIMAAKYGISIEGADCYCSLQPCSICLLSLTQAGIKNIFYVNDYDKCNYSDDLVKTVNSLGTFLVKI